MNLGSLRSADGHSQTLRPDPISVCVHREYLLPSEPDRSETERYGVCCEPVVPRVSEKSGEW